MELTLIHSPKVSTQVYWKFANKHFPTIVNELVLISKERYDSQVGTTRPSPCQLHIGDSIVEGHIIGSSRKVLAVCIEKHWFYAQYNEL